ncbi:MAG: acryloyl-CoA reductase [Pontimonas sp.]|nr:acryloyl-CoA reductase [Pontimonas sp.]
MANHATGWWVSSDGSGQLATHFRDDIALSQMGEGSLTIDVHYSALNYKDALALTGSPGVVRKPPLIPGIDCAGIVSQSSDPGVPIGTAVVITGYGYGENRHGGLATQVVADSEHVIPVPEGLSLKEAATIGTAGITAGLAITALLRNGVNPNSVFPIAVTGAAGGVGSLALALLSHEGFRAVAITGRTDEADYLTMLGAIDVISRQEFLAQPSRPLLPERFAGAIDQAGGEMLATLLASTQNYGAVIACGLAGGSDLSTTVLPFILRGVSLLGINSVFQPHDVRSTIWEHFARAKLPLDQIAQVVDLTDALDVAPRVLSGLTRGRVVVAIGA